MNRMNWLDKLIMAAILILLAALLQSPAKAAETAKYTLQDENAEIILLDSPCVQPWVKEFVTAVRPDLAERLQRAVGNFNYPRLNTWKVHEGCWIEFTADEMGFPAIGHIWDDESRYLEPKERFTGGLGV